MKNTYVIFMGLNQKSKHQNNQDSRKRGEEGGRHLIKEIIAENFASLGEDLNI